MQIERIEQQIETYTSSLSHAVQSGSGAQFSMLLSLINSAEDLVSKTAKVSGAEFKLPEPEGLHYPDPDSLYSPEVVERLNRSFTEERPADLAYLLSHINYRTQRPENSEVVPDYFARVGLASAGKLMLSEIETSGQLFSAKA